MKVKPITKADVLAASAVTYEDKVISAINGYLQEHASCFSQNNHILCAKWSDLKNVSCYDSHNFDSDKIIELYAKSGIKVEYHWSSGLGAYYFEISLI